MRPGPTLCWPSSWAAPCTGCGSGRLRFSWTHSFDENSAAACATRITESRLFGVKRPTPERQFKWEATASPEVLSVTDVELTACDWPRRRREYETESTYRTDRLIGFDWTARARTAPDGDVAKQFGTTSGGYSVTHPITGRFPVEVNPHLMNGTGTPWEISIAVSQPGRFVRGTLFRSFYECQGRALTDV